MVSDGVVGELVGKIYAAPTHPLGMRSIVRPLEEVLNGNVAIFARRPASVSTVAFCSTCSPDMAAYYETSLWTDDRAMGQVPHVPVGKPILDSRLVADRQRLGSSFYNDYLGALGCDRGLYVPFLKKGDAIFLVSAQRSARTGDYDEEVALAATLAPHLARSFLTWQRLKALEEEKAAALAGLKQAGLAMLVVNRCGMILSGNDVAEAWLGSDLFRVVNGRICTVDRRDAAKLRRAVERATREEGAESHTIQLTSAAGARLTVTVSPHPAGSASAGGEPLAMLLFKCSRPRTIDERFMAEEYGVTPAEMRLLKALVKGEHLSAYAARHNISVTTVKTHLTSLFDKTGRRRQADLIRFVLDASPLH